VDRNSTDHFSEARKNMHSILVGKPAGKRQLEKFRHKWEYIIKVGFKETG